MELAVSTGACIAGETALAIPVDQYSMLIDAIHSASLDDELSDVSHADERLNHFLVGESHYPLPEAMEKLSHLAVHMHRTIRRNAEQLSLFAQHRSAHAKRSAPGLKR